MDSPKGLRLVEKAVQIIDQIATNGEMTIAQLAQETGEPRSSMYRLISALQNQRLIEPATSRGHFRLGVRLIAWGGATQAGITIRDRALKSMEQLNLETGLTVFLVVRRESLAVCIERLEGLRVASMLLQLGGTLPLHAGAGSRALLAFEDESEWHVYAEHADLSAFTSHTVSTPKALFKVLREERELGYTRSDEDVTAGIASMGVPVFGIRGRVEGAISVSGLRHEVLGRSEERVSSLLTAAGRETSRLLGWTDSSE